VLLLGKPGSGKSDLALRLLDRGFVLVADDRVEVIEGIARAPVALAGLLEVRGLGIVCLPALPQVRLALAVELDAPGARLPAPERHAMFGVPVIRIDPGRISASQMVGMALDCATGRTRMVAGAFGHE
jgi:HPr kinase/phosphorylase